MKAKIAKRAIDALQPGGSIFDTEVRGFVARRLQSGAVTYGFRYRTAGRRVWLALGLHGSITPDQARDLAKKRAGEVADDRDPAAERETARATSENTVNKVFDEFIIRYVRKQGSEGEGLRTADVIERTIERLVRPRIGDRSIYDLGRRDIVELLDGVEDASGPVMADRTLAHLRKCFNWYAARDDRFTPPIIRGMARTKPKERARTRILDDQEIRDVFRALDELHAEQSTRMPACYPGFVRALLLTAQRRSDVSGMRSEELATVDAGKIWVISPERFKTGVEQVIPVTEQFDRLIGDRRGFIFSSDSGKHAFRGYSKAKATLDDKIAELRKRDGRKGATAHWTHHDLRRTARSLMSRAGVSSDVAERVLGHAIPGVRGVYDRHDFLAEKTSALQKLAALVERILDPGAAVVAFPTKAKPTAK